MALQFHHLIPRKVHRRTHFRKHYTREQLSEGIYLCRPCHRALHKFFDEMTLAREYCTLERLAADVQVQRHINWVRKQKTAS